RTTNAHATAIAAAVRIPSATGGRLISAPASRWDRRRPGPGSKAAPEAVGRPAVELDGFHVLPACMGGPLAGEVAGRDRLACVETQENPLDRAEQDVRTRHIGHRERLSERVEHGRVDRDAVRGGVPPCRLDRDPTRVPTPPPARPEPARGPAPTRSAGATRSRTAAVERTPDPQPTSRSEPPRSPAASSSTQRRVV